jgi:subtilisin family serine protease
MRIPWWQASLLFLLLAPDRLPAYKPGGGTAADAARAIVSARTGIPAAELTVANAATADFPLTGVRAEVFKIADPSGEIHPVAVDASGTEVDPEALEDRESRTYDAVYGKLDEELYGWIGRVDPAEPVPVAIWLEVPEHSGPTRPEVSSGPEAARVSEEELDILYAELDAARSAAIAEVAGPYADRLRSSGHTVELDATAPVLHATLPAGLVDDWAAEPEVRRVSLEHVYAEQLAIAGPSVGADLIHAQGINGRGVRLAQVEVGGRVALNNPFLPGVTQDGVDICGGVSGHSTAVAGIIVSTDGTERGIGFGAALRAYGSCNGNERELRRRSTAAADWGARALNLSFGRDAGRDVNAFDRFYDDLVQNRWRTVVISAGNNSDDPAVCGASATGTANVGSPGTAYNVITVGNFSNQLTVAPGDDVMARCSSWRDPDSRNGDREKPEIAAPGVNIFTTSPAAPWFDFFSGTSAAAPVVTGSIGLLLQRNPNLAPWPETIRALFMATAVHNIEGATRLSEVDGAGGIRVDLADRVVQGQAGGFGGRSYGCSTSRNLDVATMNLAAGVPVRVVISWDTNPGYLSYGRQPSADLDLRILNPAGGTVATSASWDNTSEIVEFTPATSGVYRLRVYRYRCALLWGNPKWLGWAWYQEPQPPARRGMTWAKTGHSFNFGADRFNCAGCNPYVGDALCTENHPILCIRPDGSPNPGLPVNFDDGWIGGNVGLSANVRGDQLLSLANADAICANTFGPGWAMAEFHHPGGGWGWSSRGNVNPAGRYWVHINDQPGNCWN